MSEQLINEIEAKLDSLIQRHLHLSEAHQALSHREQAWLTERARLIEKNEIARTRIEAMISRMKQLETTAE